jgi:glycine cleavage system aminomethyltransferase T
MPVNPLADVHAELGAVLVERAGTRVPARFGDAADEHSAVRRSAGVFDLASAGRFWVRGPERLRFLDGLLAADVWSLQPGSGTYALLLTREGRISTDLRVAVLEDRALVLTPSMTRGKVARTFERHKVASEVTIDEAHDGWTLLSAQGPAAPAVVAAALGTAIPEVAPWGAADVAATVHGPVVVLRSPRTGEEGLDVVVRASSAAALFRRLVEEARAAGGLPCGLDALDSLRIEAGRPAFGAEMDETSTPAEVTEPGRGITWSKGCFLGREPAERAAAGRPARRLAGLAFAGAAPPAAGTALRIGGANVGRVTSACFSPVLGRPIGLGLVEPDCAQRGADLDLPSGERAQVAALPFVPWRLA